MPAASSSKKKKSVTGGKKPSGGKGDSHSSGINGNGNNLTDSERQARKEALLNTLHNSNNSDTDGLTRSRSGLGFTHEPDFALFDDNNDNNDNNGNNDENGENVNDDARIKRSREELERLKRRASLQVSGANNEDNDNNDDGYDSSNNNQEQFSFDADSLDDSEEWNDDVLLGRNIGKEVGGNDLDGDNHGSDNDIGTDEEYLRAFDNDADEDLDDHQRGDDKNNDPEYIKKHSKNAAPSSSSGVTMSAREVTRARKMIAEAERRLEAATAERETARIVHESRSKDRNSVAADVSRLESRIASLNARLENKEKSRGGKSKERFDGGNENINDFDDDNDGGDDDDDIAGDVHHHRIVAPIPGVSNNATATELRSAIAESSEELAALRTILTAHATRVSQSKTDLDSATAACNAATADLASLAVDSQRLDDLAAAQREQRLVEAKKQREIQQKSLAKKRAKLAKIEAQRAAEAEAEAEKAAIALKQSDAARKRVAREMSKVNRDISAKMKSDQDAAKSVAESRVTEAVRLRESVKESRAKIAAERERKVSKAAAKERMREKERVEIEKGGGDSRMVFARRDAAKEVEMEVAREKERREKAEIEITQKLMRERERENKLKKKEEEKVKKDQASRYGPSRSSLNEEAERKRVREYLAARFDSGAGGSGAAAIDPDAVVDAYFSSAPDERMLERIRAKYPKETFDEAAIEKMRAAEEEMRRTAARGTGPAATVNTKSARRSARSIGGGGGEDSDDSDEDPLEAAEERPVLVDTELTGEGRAVSQRKIGVRMSKLETQRLEDAKARQRASLTKPQVVMGKQFNGPAFTTNPSEIVFDDFETGRVYTKVITVTNVSFTVNSFRLLPLPADVKVMFEIEYTPNVQLSAGLTTQIKITFTPQSMKSAVDAQLIMLAQTGECPVRIRCSPKQTVIRVEGDDLLGASAERYGDDIDDMPEDAEEAAARRMDFGDITIGETTSRTLTIVNDGAYACPFEVECVQPIVFNSKNNNNNDDGDGDGDGDGNDNSIDDDGAADDSDILNAADAFGRHPSEYEWTRSKKVSASGDLDADKLMGVYTSQATAGSALVAMRKERRAILRSGDTHSRRAIPIVSCSVDAGVSSPYSTTKLTIKVHPHGEGPIPHGAIVKIRFGSDEVEDVDIVVRARGTDVPVKIDREVVEFGVCYKKTLYREKVVLTNAGRVAVKAEVEPPEGLAEYLEFQPKVGFLQAFGEPFEVNIKFRPGAGLLAAAAEHGDPSTGFLELPVRVTIPTQVLPVFFLVRCRLASSAIKFNVPQIDFGRVPVTESREVAISMTNCSVLPQKYGFVGLPKGVDILPCGGFGELLPLETAERRVIFSATAAAESRFDITCMNMRGESYSLPCVARGVKPIAAMDVTNVSLPATAVLDSRGASLKITNNLKDEPIMFEFAVGASESSNRSVLVDGRRQGDDDADDACDGGDDHTMIRASLPTVSPEISMTPAVGELAPGESRLVRVMYNPTVEGVSLVQLAGRGEDTSQYVDFITNARRSTGGRGTLKLEDDNSSSNNDNGNGDRGDGDVSQRQKQQQQQQQGKKKGADAKKGGKGKKRDAEEEAEALEAQRRAEEEEERARARREMAPPAPVLPLTREWVVPCFVKRASLVRDATVRGKDRGEGADVMRVSVTCTAVKPEIVALPVVIDKKKNDDNSSSDSIGNVEDKENEHGNQDHNNSNDNNNDSNKNAEYARSTRLPEQGRIDHDSPPLQAIDFGRVPVGSNKVLTFVVQNCGDRSCEEPRWTPFHPLGPFSIVNSMRQIQSGSYRVVHVKFAPTAQTAYIERIELKTGLANDVLLMVTGTGIGPSLDFEPAIDTDPEPWSNVTFAKPLTQVRSTVEKVWPAGLVDFGDVVAGGSAVREYELVNTGVFPCEFSFEMSTSTGRRNHNGTAVFDVSPPRGTVPSGGSLKVTMTFSPDHESLEFQGAIRMDVKDAAHERTIRLLGRGWERGAFVAASTDFVRILDDKKISKGEGENENLTGGQSSSSSSGKMHGGNATSAANGDGESKQEDRGRPDADRVEANHHLAFPPRRSRRDDPFALPPALPDGGASQGGGKGSSSSDASGGMKRRAADFGTTTVTLAIVPQVVNVVDSNAIQGEEAGGEDRPAYALDSTVRSVDVGAPLISSSGDKRAAVEMSLDPISKEGASLGFSLIDNSVAGGKVTIESGTRKSIAFRFSPSDDIIASMHGQWVETTVSGSLRGGFPSPPSSDGYPFVVQLRGKVPSVLN